MTSRISVPRWVLTGLLLAGSQLCAQVQVTDNTRMTMNGSATVGYSASAGNVIQSSHSLYFGVNGDIRGYYYHPNFLSFDVLPTYGREQSNNEFGNTSNVEGYSANARIFGGSHFPGSFTFGQSWNSLDTFGFGGSDGLVTTSKRNLYGVGWSALIPDWPTLTVSYNQSSDSSDLAGTSDSFDSRTRIFDASSVYKILGFQVNGRFERQGTTTDSPGFSEFNQSSASDSVTHSYQVSANHTFPLHGSFNVAYGHNSFESDSLTASSNGTNDNANSQLNFSLLQNMPVSVSADYNSNVTAMVEQQLLASGVVIGPYQQLKFGGRQLLLNISTSYTGYLPHRIVYTGYVGHTERLLDGSPYGVTQFGGNIGYNFGKFIKGLTVSAGVFDMANRFGNLGASIVGNVSYDHQFGPWDFSAQFGHDQSVETLGVFRTVSSYSYGSTVRRRLGHQWRVYVGGGGGHSGFGSQAGTGSHSEYGNLGLTWRRYSASGNYTQSTGASLLSINGLVPVPNSLNGELPASPFILYNARSYGINLSAVPQRKLMITGIYRKFDSNLSSSVVNSGTVSSLIGFRVIYRMRKLSFQAGSNTTRQNLNTLAPGTPQLVTSYYFGISRWFNVF